jgi:hypothetical protein
VLGLHLGARLFGVALRLADGPFDRALLRDVLDRAPEPHRLPGLVADHLAGADHLDHVPAGPEHPDLDRVRPPLLHQAAPGVERALQVVGVHHAALGHGRRVLDAEQLAQVARPDEAVVLGVVLPTAEAGQPLRLLQLVGEFGGGPQPFGLGFQVGQAQAFGHVGDQEPGAHHLAVVEPDREAAQREPPPGAVRTGCRHLHLGGRGALGEGPPAELGQVGPQRAALGHGTPQQLPARVAAHLDERLVDPPVAQPRVDQRDGHRRRPDRRGQLGDRPRLAVLQLDLLGHVELAHHDADHRARAVAQRVPAAQEVADRVAERHGHVLARLRLAAVEHLPRGLFERGGRLRREQLAGPPAQVRLLRQAVDLGEAGVDVPVAQVGVEYREADRDALQDRSEQGDPVVEPAGAVLGGQPAALGAPRRHLQAADDGDRGQRGQAESGQVRPGVTLERDPAAREQDHEVVQEGGQHHRGHPGRPPADQAGGDDRAEQDEDARPLADVGEVEHDRGHQRHERPGRRPPPAHRTPPRRPAARHGRPRPCPRFQGCVSSPSPAPAGATVITRLSPVTVSRFSTRGMGARRMSRPSVAASRL